jgi:stage IV sporulation protein B
LLKGKVHGVICGILIFLSVSLPCLDNLAPGRYSVAAGEPFQFNFPFAVEKNLTFNSKDASSRLARIGGGQPGSFIATEPGLYTLNVRLFGLIPLKDVVVTVLPQVKVIPGGQSIGVLMHPQGIIVVDSSAVTDQAGHKNSPAFDAGLKPGDVIVKIDSVPVKSEDEVREMVARAGAAGLPLLVEYKRGDEVRTSKIEPVYCSETMRYRIGLLIKDVAAGVGTMTFYEPKSKVYGALGHVITDSETARPVEIADGKIVGTVVQGIHRGKRGQPGEKIGMFSNDDQIAGGITKNTSLGIFGHLQQAPGAADAEPVPVATSDQVHEGPAEILTVLKGDQVESFAIEITRLSPSARADGKGMLIKVTDPRLIEETGGIIQGMSGSPIIQDGRLAGAVTHVLVNDPTRGFGTFAEWMLWEAGILSEQSGQEKLAG